MTSPIDRKSVRFDEQKTFPTRPSSTLLQRVVNGVGKAALFNKAPIAAERPSPPRSFDLSDGELGEEKIHELALSRFSGEEQILIQQEESKNLIERFKGQEDLRARYHQSIGDVINEI